MKQSAPLGHGMTSDWLLRDGNMAIAICTGFEQKADVKHLIQVPQDLVFGFDSSF